MSKQKLIAMVLGVAMVGGAAAYLFMGGGTGTFKNLNLGVFNIGTSDVQKSGSSTSEGSRTSQDLSENYSNSSYGFSFRMPYGFSASEIEEEQGTMILAHGDPSTGSGQAPSTGSTGPPQASSGRKEFQIFISAFDEPGPITAERIKEDLPEMVVENPQQVLMGEGKKIQALIFLSQHESLGRVREVWFVWPSDPSLAGNQLYQITTYADMDSVIGPILDTLKFNE